MDVQTVAKMHRPQGLPFRCNKIGHVALYVKDPYASAKFYTEVMGFSISDVYDSAMMPGGTGVPALCRRSPRRRAVQAARGPAAAWRVPPHGVRGLDTGRGAAGPRTPPSPRRGNPLRGPPPRRRA